MKESKFKLVSQYKTCGDQPKAIEELVSGLNSGKHEQVLLGATGTGKTFTIANVIERVNKPTLVFAHNKTLAGQLYSEFKTLFPNNAVEYFVSNFDYYQPEAYMPKTDTYIEKNAVTNDEIDMLRMSTYNSLLERKDVIVVEDIVDSGRTLSYLLELLGKRNPKSLALCTMLDKPERRVVDVKVDYTGFNIPDEFVVGYGLDYDQRYRNLPYIGVVEFD